MSVHQSAALESSYAPDLIEHYPGRSIVEIRISALSRTRQISIDIHRIEIHIRMSCLAVHGTALHNQYSACTAIKSHDVIDNESY